MIRLENVVDLRRVIYIPIYYYLSFIYFTRLRFAYFSAFEI